MKGVEFKENVRNRISFCEDISIDPDALDKEFIRQPGLMGRWCREMADARADADRAKERRDLVVAELDKDIRSHLEKFGIEKITETVLSNTIKMQDDYQEAVLDYIEANHSVEVFGAAVKALDHKRSALENLVRLHGQEYFANPSLKDIEPEAAQNITRRRSKNEVRERIRRRRNDD